MLTNVLNVTLDIIVLGVNRSQMHSAHRDIFVLLGHKILIGAHVPLGRFNQTMDRTIKTEPMDCHLVWLVMKVTFVKRLLIGQ